MTKFLDLFANPDRVGAVFHGDPGLFDVSETLVYPSRVGSEPTPVDDFAVFVERAVMAPDVSKVC